MAGGLISPSFVSEASDHGILGSLATGYMSLNQIAESLSQINTTMPYQANIFVDYKAYGNKPFKKPKKIIQLEKELARYGVPVISTTFGLLRNDTLSVLRKNNIILMTTVNSVEEAQASLCENDGDVIIFQSREAGGHRGGFLDAEYSDERLILDIKKSSPPNKFFIKSGGVVNGEDVRKAINSGFDGVQIGTGFLMTAESSATDLYKTELTNISNLEDLQITRSVTGKSARGIRNTLTQLSYDEECMPAYPFLHYATKDVREHSKAKGLTEYQSLWAGTSALRINTISNIDEYINELTRQF